MKRDKNNHKREGDTDTSNLLKDNDFLALKEVYTRLKFKYNNLEILSALEKEEIFIPLSIFNNKLSSLEVISKYLFENQNLSLIEISKLLNRSNRNIWNAYNRSKKKFPDKLAPKESILMPISGLRNLNFTLLENIVLFLKENIKLSYHEIAVLLQRDDRTIWTVYQRAKKK